MRKMTGRMREKRGVALVQAIVLVAIMATLGAALISLALTQMRVANRRSLLTQALNLAQMGIDEAHAEFRANRNFIANGASRSYPLDDERQFVLTRNDRVEKDADGNPVTIIQVTSVGTVTPGGFAENAVRKRLRINLGFKGGDGIFDFVLASNQTLSLSGSTVINSVSDASKVPNSPKKPKSSDLLNGAKVHSNNDVILGGNTRIGGDVTASGQVTGEDGRVTGDALDGQGTLVFPAITQQMKDLARADGDPTATTDVTLDNGEILKGWYQQNVTIGDGGAEILDGHVVWIQGNLTLTGFIKGNGTIIVDGTITLDQGNTDVVGGHIVFMSTSTSSSAVQLTGNQTMRGYFYAPNGGIVSSGAPNIIGSIVADRISLSGNTGLYQDENSDIPINPLPRYMESKGWEEL